MLQLDLQQQVSSTTYFIQTQREYVVRLKALTQPLSFVPSKGEDGGRSAYMLVVVCKTPKNTKVVV